MVKVLVLGATGLAGTSISIALKRAGHITYGLARSEEKAKALSKEEVIPIIGDIWKQETWVPTATEVDIIIDATSNSTDPISHYDQILKTAETAAQKRDRFLPKLAFITLSGIWAYGGHQTMVHTESSPSNLPPALAWIVDVENKVLSSKDLNGIVIRGGVFYGKKGAITGMWFGGALAGAISMPGNKDIRWAWVHIDDLADGFVRAAERADQIAGQILILANNQTESVGDCLAAVSRVTGLPDGKISYRPADPNSFLDNGLILNQIASNGKAYALLGWRPRQLGFIDGIEIYYNSWKAHNL